MSSDSNTAEPSVSELRAAAEGCIAAGKHWEAHALLAQIWQRDPAPALAGFIGKQFASLSEHLPVIKQRLGILRSFTVEPIVPLLRAGAAVYRVDLDVEVGQFNAYAQEVFDPSSFLYSQELDVMLLAVQLSDIAPELADGFAELPLGEIAGVAERVAGEMRSWLETIRSRSAAHVMVHNFEVPTETALGVSDVGNPSGQIAAVHDLNRQLQKLAEDIAGVSVVDYGAMVARAGSEAWHDPVRWNTVRLPMKADRLNDVARGWLQHLMPVAGRVCKAVVCDLDNTLWGGVVGEDGVAGIKLGLESKGIPFRALQQTLLNLRARGILLAICSKNNHEDALEAINGHPEMLLREEHFSAMRINWQPKSQNLSEIAQELNIGIDSLAFLDDNPVERLQVRGEHPEVAVLELPADANLYAPMVAGCPLFQRLSVSSEDRSRSEMYAQQKQRAELQQSTGSLEDFYRSLEMKITFGEVDDLSLQRVAQLTQKTNQLNMTTRRYSEQQISEFAADPAKRVYWVQVVDRFGDNGIIGVMIVEALGTTWEIVTFLMSCRVISRSVETAMLGFLCEQAAAAGAMKLAGDFLPTKKNAPAEKIYADHGFQETEASEQGSRWELELSQRAIAIPEWFERVESAATS